FVQYVKSASRVLPVVGVNLFQHNVAALPQLVPQSIQAGARRVKILKLTAIGRCKSEHFQVTWSPQDVESMIGEWLGPLASGVEIRIEGPLLAGSLFGDESCVLRERPLLSVDHDGSVYPCCVTVGVRSAALGCLRTESLQSILANSTA